MSEERPISERIGAALGLVLDLDTASYCQLREEFLAMTAAARLRSGWTRAEIVKIVKPEGISKGTVYNYSGDPKYKSFPQPKPLTVYLRACGFTSEEVVFAVARCELIRILYPEGEKSSPPSGTWPLPLNGEFGVLCREYELRMREATEQIRTLLGRVEAGQVALEAIDSLMFPFAGGQEGFLRLLFANAGVPLPVDVDFAPKAKMAPLEKTAVRPGDIIRTEHGYLGILTESHRLIYLGKRGWPASMVLGERVLVVAWRARAVQQNYQLASGMSRVPAGRGRIPRLPPLVPPRYTAVIALVCEKLEAALQRGVDLPISAREIFEAAVEVGVEFDYTVRAWNPMVGLSASAPSAPVGAQSRTAVPQRRVKHVVRAPLELDEMGVVGEIVRWYVQIGVQVRAGDPLVRIENPLAALVLDVFAPAEGTVTAITAVEGEIVGSGRRLAVVTARIPERR